MDKTSIFCYNYIVWGSIWFRHVLLGMTASGWQSLNAKLKLNDEANYSFAPSFA